MGKGKNVFASKLAILGFLQFAVSLVVWLSDQDLVKQYPQAVAAIGMITGVLTIILRTVTSVPVEWFPKDNEQEDTDPVVVSSKEEILTDSDWPATSR